MATKVASLFGVLSLDDKDFIKGLGVAKSGILDVGDGLKTMGGGLADTMTRVGDRVASIGGQLTVLSGAIDAVLGPLMGFGQEGVDAAVSFDESMKNIQAAAGYTGDEMAVISDQVMAIGEASRYGPQQAADAFYEISSGVADASVRMGMFEASVHAAQAGNAELASTTKAMVGLMNGYGFAADKAGFASDVLTRIVGMGVGSMDEFGAALASAAKFAPTYGIGLEDLGSQLAYLTTKNIPAAQSATILNSMITTLLSPTKDLAAAIKEAGYTSGEAMIKAEGLAGAYDILKTDNGGSLSGLITNTEALAGATLLANDEFKKFDDTFKGSSVVVSDGPRGLVDNMDLVSGAIQGATADAEAIQMSSTAAQFDLLTSSVDSLKIAVGDNLMPVLVDLTNNVLKPIVQGVTDWVKQNPQLSTGLFLVVGAVSLLGVGLGIVGGLMSAFGVALGVVSPLLGLLPAGMTLSAAGSWLMSAGMTAAGAAAGLLTGAIGLLLSPIGFAIAAAVLMAAAYFSNFGGIKDFIDTQVRPIIEGFFNFLAGVWELVRPGLVHLEAGFNTAMATISAIIKKPEEAIKVVTDAIGGWWAGVKGGIDSFVAGIEKGLQPAVDFIEGIAGAINNVLTSLGLVQAQVGSTPVAEWTYGPPPDMNTFYDNLAAEGGGPKAAGGPVMGGVPYTVGEQGREVFIPESSGTIIPNGQTEGMMGNTFNVTVIANTAEGGRAAADAFDARLKEKMASR